MRSKVEPRPSIYDAYRTVREIVQHKLTEDILAGRFGPGERLREAELAERYGVSRGPVREAVRALEGQGLVTFRANRGAIVRRESRDELEEIYDVVLALEGLALAPLAQPLAPASFAPLEKSWGQMVRTRNPETWLVHNDEFHKNLLRLGGRLRVCRMIEDLFNALMPYARVWAKLDEGGLARANAEHREVLDALEASDFDLVRTLTAQHRLRAKDQIAAALVSEERLAAAASAEGGDNS